MLHRTLTLSILTAVSLTLSAGEPVDTVAVAEDVVVTTVVTETATVTPPDSIFTDIAIAEPFKARPAHISLYELPYSRYTKSYDWKHLWINTGILVGAYVGTLVVLECLPEDATSWNRADLQKDPPAKRWVDNIFRRGPEWDHDNPIFNYVLHPYAGAVYFMCARSCGFNFYQSLLYSAIISTVGWEFGIEACMERPSIQDIFVTPLAGCVIGELFYKLKRNIVSHGYRLFGSPVIGNIVAFLIDPVNEVVSYFGHSETRRVARELGRRQPAVTSSLTPFIGRNSAGFSLVCTF